MPMACMYVPLADPSMCTQTFVSSLSASKSSWAREQGKDVFPLNYFNADLYQGPAFLSGRMSPVNTEHSVYFKHSISGLRFKSFQNQF